MRLAECNPNDDLGGNMIIAISGLTGSGKNTLGEILAKRLGYKLVCPTFKDLAKKEGISLMDFQKKAANDSNIDLKFDELLKEEVSATGGNCVVTTWLGAWILNADITVYVDAPSEVRAERIAKRDKLTVKKALVHLNERDEQNRKRYLKVYGIDIYKTDFFDLKLDSSKNKPEKLADIVEEFIKTRSDFSNRKILAKSTNVFQSPAGTSFLPTSRKSTKN